MSQDREQEIRLQFLEEAQEYLNTIESILLHIDTLYTEGKIDEALRAAHSIKGGAAMMGFSVLSDLSHRYEDFFKVLKAQRKTLELDVELESLLLNGVDRLLQVVDLHRRGGTISETWVQDQVNPIFDQLQGRLGEPSSLDATLAGSEEEELDMVAMLFESEVESSLQRLEMVLETPGQPCLLEELTILSQELGGLGEMLEVEAFTQLCNSVLQQAEQIRTEQLDGFARAAVEVWRRSQALVLLGQREHLPTQLELPAGLIVTSEEKSSEAVLLSEASQAPELNEFAHDPEMAELEALVNAAFVYSEITAGLPIPSATESSGEAAIVSEANTASDLTSAADWVPLTAETGDQEDLSAAIAEAAGDPEAALSDETGVPEEFWEGAEPAFVGLDTSFGSTEGAPFPEFALEELISDVDDLLDHPLTLMEDAESDLGQASETETGEQPSNAGSRFLAENGTHESLQQFQKNLLAQLLPPQSLDSDLAAVRKPRRSEDPLAKRQADKNGQLGEPVDKTVRVSVKQLDQLNDLFGELAIGRNGLDLNLGRLGSLFRTLSYRMQFLQQSNLRLRSAYDRVSTQSRLSPELASSENGHKKTGEQNGLAQVGNPSAGFDILELDQYSEIHQLSQEVMETIVQVQETIDDLGLSLEDTDQTARDLNRTAKQMQMSLTQVRMRPLSEIVNRFPRAIRDLSLQYGKTVELQVYGAGTLIDRAVLEALSDPLMHLLRNCFDHGIEAPEARVAKGKPEQGQIEIRAAYRGSQTIITIGDDGGGINLDKIRARAMQIGLDPEALNNATERELLELIFEPGFSTAEKVTALSGRGVGMDVVRTNLRQVRGEIRVDTKPGEGTTFTISVPFTLSVMRVLLVESHGLLLAFPKDEIEEMILLDPEQVMTTAGNLFLNWQGQMVPLVDLSQCLKLHCPSRSAELEELPIINKPAVLLVSEGNQLTGIRIDRCWKEQEVAIRQVEGEIAMPVGFAGCTILGNGRVVPLVDAGALLSHVMDRGQATAVRDFTLITPELPPEVEERLPNAILPVPQQETILIVDDSINVRRLLALTLEKAGYQVEQAKDGQDALEKLLSGLQVQAVICDIEMPRLDGYSFLARVKGESTLKSLPIAMLTSRSGEKHRRLAMNLGAAAYFSKPYREPELLQTLKQLIAQSTFVLTS